MQDAQLAEGESLSLWEKAAQTGWGRYITGREREVVARVAREPAPGLLVDNGCGEGRWTQLVLAHPGWRALCLDVDPVALRKCGERNPGAKCVLVSEQDQRIPAEDGSASLVLVIEVPGLLEADWFQAELQRVLMPGGRLVGVFHNRNSLRGYYRALVDRCRRDFCFYRMSFTRWRRAMAIRGVDVTAAEGLCWFPFRRTSDSRWIPFFTTLEAAIGLRAWSWFSPWVLFTAQKRS